MIKQDLIKKIDTSVLDPTWYMGNTKIIPITKTLNEEWGKYDASGGDNLFYITPTLPKNHYLVSAKIGTKAAYNNPSIIAVKPGTFNTTVSGDFADRIFLMQGEGDNTSSVTEQLISYPQKKHISNKGLQYTSAGNPDYVTLDKVIDTSNSSTWELSFNIKYTDFGSGDSSVAFFASNASAATSNSAYNWLRLTFDDGTTDLQFEGKLGQGVSSAFTQKPLDSQYIALNTVYNFKFKFYSQAPNKFYFYVNNVQKDIITWHPSTSCYNNIIKHIGRPTAVAGTTIINDWKIALDDVDQVHYSLTDNNAGSANEDRVEDLSGNNNYGIITNSHWSSDLRPDGDTTLYQGNNFPNRYDLGGYKLALRNDDAKGEANDSEIFGYVEIANME